jgi:hypothetical protein
MAPRRFARRAAIEAVLLRRRPRPLQHVGERLPRHATQLAGDERRLAIGESSGNLLTASLPAGSVESI